MPACDQPVDYGFREKERLYLTMNEKIQQSSGKIISMLKVEKA